MTTPRPRWRDLPRALWLRIRCRSKKPDAVTTCTPGFGWSEGDLVTFSDGPAMRVSRITSDTTLELEPASLWRHLLRRVWRFIDTAVQVFGLVCLPLLLIAGMTSWVWFPLVVAWCAYWAGRAHG